jgi:hypothetical protein
MSGMPRRPREAAHVRILLKVIRRIRRLIELRRMCEVKLLGMSSLI